MVNKKNYTFDVYFNPLSLYEIDYAQQVEEELSETAIIRFLSSPGADNSLENLRRRYLQINNANPNLVVVPTEERILNKLIWPLRHAKASYVIGNPLGTISLCGIVSEMVAILYFDISQFGSGKNHWSPKKQVGVFGSKFEDLGQFRRVKVLESLGLIDAEQRDNFDTIRSKRKQHLHLYSKDFLNIDSDAIACFESAVSLVVSLVGQSFESGKLQINSEFGEYLNRIGFAK